MDNYTENRPWGSFTILEDTPTHKVKKIAVKPTGKLSLQSHSKRSEIWTMVAGVGTITIGDTIKDYRVGEIAVIPVETKHRIENRGEIDAVFIEVQTGSYFGEDDIVRYEDAYGRV